MTDRGINATAASLLGLLHQGPMTGWDLMRAAETRLGNFWSLTQSQVYRELATMASTGLVEEGVRGHRDRRPYSLTEPGRAAFLDWIAEPPATESIRYPLLLTVAFGRHLPPATLRRLILEQREIHEKRLAGYDAASATAAGADAFTLATLRFGIRHEEATLAWFDELPRLLSDHALAPRSSS